MIQIHKNSYFCILSEIKRQYNIEFIKILKHVRLAMHTKDDIKYIENMKNNKIDIIDNPIYMCALNKDVDEINKSSFNKNANETYEFKKSVKYYSHIKDDVTEIKTLPINNMLFIKETTERGETVILKKDLKVMITENLDVENGICNGTTGYASDIKKINKKVVVEVLLKNNKIINISTQIVTLEKNIINDALYTITNEFMPKNNVMQSQFIKHKVRHLKTKLY